MVKEFVEAYMRNEKRMRTRFAAKCPGAYEDIVREVIECINDYGDNEGSLLKPLPDPERIHQIDDGCYQGTLVFVIGEHGYQPSEYWYVRMEYGSCAICDTLQSIEWSGSPTEQQLDDMMTLALHVVQQLRPMRGQWNCQPRERS